MTPLPPIEADEEFVDLFNSDFDIDTVEDPILDDEVTDGTTETR